MTDRTLTNRTLTPATAAPANPGVRQDWRHGLSGPVFVATVLLVWVTLHPFQSLSTSASVELSSGNEGLTYAAFLALAGVAFAVVLPRLRIVWRCLMVAPILAMAGWMLVTSVISEDPGTSLRRLVLTGLVVTLAACLFLLPNNQAKLARLLAICALTVLILSYLGVILVPGLAIHQATDLGEPELAGNWRGLFGHKNDASAVMSLFVIIGLFIARCRMPVTGSAIMLLAVVFLLFSGGKSSLMLIIITLGVSSLWGIVRGPVARALLAFGPALLLNLLGVGSVLWPNIGSVTKALPLDTTFTGRTDIWAFAIDSLPGHYLTGHGFQAFWNTAKTWTGGEDASWAGTAAHAHNGYLDLIVNMGLPGLGFGLFMVAWMPFRDVLAAERNGTDPALLAMLRQIWIFGLSLSAMETFLFLRADPVWLTFLFAIFGLRYAASFPLRGLAEGRQTPN
ncbi:O-antigen ligase family protein [Lichenihabitans sp. PAMC28606]|uniref:O-antigen ligase family protein n=1 Tax=Lichenihabitans sp. PAMC28606 TaxID=2880932 RepID=UPI001D0AE8EF|nr:O-antigen ligase [Lichenihabitans sp. PAMC28606]UDL93817.1 O-antigen ligase family protein [Lichenihabitans sp. PAMC28606]